MTISFLGPAHVYHVSVEIVSCSTPLSMDGGMSGNLTSPGYPDNYPHHVDCEWRLQLPQSSGFNISLHLTSVDIEPSLMCLWDAVEVRSTNKWFYQELGMLARELSSCVRVIPNDIFLLTSYSIKFWLADQNSVKVVWMIPRRQLCALTRPNVLKEMGHKTSVFAVYRIFVLGIQETFCKTPR